ncbi:hypothetical protein KFL_013690010 [Klebsormidium nitens]|uniref:DSBA-like thioredoxin domain-containing protein n=1 Tax=Klebsormidium nitens TaxID=105231 RepID=A0A1Y1IQU1_KLENI|nr:hypothetical protein KFL_013690010 [Klebsormidium nitens]|eukprot:GAQ93220.1 hypothetical protein KFL_013690010 [Klebsormidium nitens]
MAAASVANAVKVHIDAWSDIACPWCYVGKARLDQAIRNVEMRSAGKPLKVEVAWHPYMIDLGTNPAGEDYLAYNKRRWGSGGWTQSLRGSGARNGLKFKDWNHWPNTLHAHRLVDLASSVGKGPEAEDVLFRRTYELGQNVSSLDVLIEAGQELDLPGVEEYLRSDQGLAEVKQQDRDAKSRMQIRSVPYFVLQQEYALSGAQDVKTFQEAIERAAEIQ